MQVSFDTNGDPNASTTNDQYHGGSMIPCPAGTFRETPHHAITECIDCPPSYYRKDIEGKSSLDYSKCPANISSKKGSTFIKGCISCSTGSYFVQASFCERIIPVAFERKQLTSSEKRMVLCIKR